MATGSMTAWQLLALQPPGWGGALLTGAATTVAISACAFSIGLVIGLFGAIGKLSDNRPVGLILKGYTSVIRAVPELILIVGLYYAGTDG
ncbi:MAG: ABC transporter permease subunit, partial [Allorhizobium sp.]